MDKRTTNIIIIAALALICACLPLCLGVLGVINWAFGEQMLWLHGNSVYYGFGGICLSILGFLVAGVVAIFLLRKKPETVITPVEEPVDNNTF
jgi:hypothetical protein